MYATVNDIDWASWDPVVRATLMFVMQDGQILLIHKKRGFGQGKINGPGGKLEPGETPLECAIRETEEELCIHPTGVEKAGELFFQFLDGHSIHGYVYTATGYTGEPTETDEAVPAWFGIDDLPFDRMWEDDPTWFPHMLEGRPFSGRYLFDGDRMVDAVIELD
ncbi:MAG: 8-oxo-dGTP diphosphatase [Pontiellaceae bacterium]|nr:8-oxo-dGTP diphosphatase [Pontiellaceae bacterium]MBN2784958.1 8-oxo-dGTP diphosphatase [Pontiellaceae bacterium]